MARPRSLDHELLRQLVTEHPDWSDASYAEKLTERKRQEDPNAAAVNVNTVASVIHRKGDAWRRNGSNIPNRWVTYGEFMPPGGTVAAEHKNATELRYLRELAKHARGDHPSPDEASKVKLRLSALNWRDKTLASGQILDLSAKGEPFYRFPTKHERDNEGRPLALAAWMLPGWRE